jgi:hypothetical protein
MRTRAVNRTRGQAVVAQYDTVFADDECPRSIAQLVGARPKLAPVVEAGLATVEVLQKVVV